MADQSDIEKLIAAVIEARTAITRWINVPEAEVPSGAAFNKGLEALDLAYGRAEHALADYVVRHAPWIIEVVNEASKR